MKKIKAFIDGEVLVLDHFSGIGHYTASLLSEVDKLLGTKEYSNFDITIGLPRNLKKRVSNYKFKNFKYRSTPFSPRVANELKRRGWIPPIDLIYGKSVYVFTHFSSWPTLKSPQIPIIYDLSFVHYPQYSAEKNQKFLIKQTDLSAKRATRIITISENSKKEIIEHYCIDSELVDVVIPILETDKFYPRSKSEIIKTKAKYGIFDDYLLFVGNIEPRKNLIGLLKAYNNLPRAIQDKYGLLLVGAKGWKDGEIHDLIEEMKERGLRIILPEKYVCDEDLPALFSGARAFAYLSFYEGYGIPPTEAMACGTAVVTSDNSSLPEAVGSGALMVNAHDTEAITKALKNVLSNDTLNRKMVRKGFGRIKKFDPKQDATLFLTSIEKAWYINEK